MNRNWLIGALLIGGGLVAGVMATGLGDGWGAPSPLNQNSDLLAEVSLAVDVPAEEAAAPSPTPVTYGSNLSPKTDPVPAAPEESAPVIPVPAVNFPGSETLSAAEVLKLAEANAAPAVPSSSPGNNPAAPSGQINHLVISEIRLTGGAGKTTEDFIELYNPGNVDVDISGWQLLKRTQKGAKDESIRKFPSGSIIPARGFFLWANSDNGYADSVNADVKSVASVAVNNSIALRNIDDLIVDSVAWGEGLVNSFGEGSVIAAVLEGSQSYERKALIDGACADPFAASESSGNGCDTDSNSADFVIRTMSYPQNSKSGTE